jgi:hypothetical protein
MNIFFIVDLTMQSTESNSLDSPASEPARLDDQDTVDEEIALNPRVSSPGPSSVVTSSTNYVKKKTSQLIGAISTSSRASTSTSPVLAPKLASLVKAFRDSDNAKSLAEEIAETERIAQADAANQHVGVNGSLPDVALENSLTRGRKRATWGTQFRILSGRAFKNLYRDPALLAAHYISSIVVARKSYFKCTFH